ncbi:MAG: peptidoglycan-associated lipoprotein Pal [Nitrospirae bacterium]|nr:peptidoglycan-associated lipoprotein Pal [Nitrospirota bacterium]
MATPPAAIAAQPAQTASQSQQPSLPITPQSPAPAPDTASKTAAATTSRNGFSDIHFDYDRYDIRPDEKPVLGKVVDWLMNNPKSRLTIEGHCDERGTNEYNLALGERRASAAMKFLTAMGIDKGRTATVSYGEERPVDTGHNEEAWAMNRRAHFVAEN